MPRVNRVNAARKARPDSGIAVGDSYYWWKFRYGGKHYSRTYPQRSDLTQSKIGEVYAALEGLEPLIDNWDNLDNLKEQISEAADMIRQVAEEYTEADEAMGGHGGIQQERADAVEQFADEVESVADNLEEYEEGNVDDWEQGINDQLSELVGMEPEIL